MKLICVELKMSPEQTKLIHYEVTENFELTKSNVEELLNKDDVYYNKELHYFNYWEVMYSKRLGYSRR